MAEYSQPGDTEPRTYRQAWNFIQKRGQRLFGSGWTGFGDSEALEVGHRVRCD